MLRHRIFRLNYVSNQNLPKSSYCIDCFIRNIFFYRQKKLSFKLSFYFYTRKTLLHFYVKMPMKILLEIHK